MKPQRSKEIIDAMFTHERGATLEETAEYVMHMDQNKFVRVEIGPDLLEESYKTFFGHPVRKDKPHFQGDEYHAHAELEGGYEVAWTVSGKRRHPGKFPAHVPDSAKAAVAKRLGVPKDLLETFWITEAGKKTLLFEVCTQA
jgi:hypothetical protein